MRIKKHSSGNEYVRAGDVWVRNFTSGAMQPVQLTRMFGPDDYSLILRNEEANKNRPRVSDEAIVVKNLVIVSDGYDFEKRHRLISKLPKETGVLAVNKAYLKWRLMDASVPAPERKPINAFVVNNPYSECLSYLPPGDAKYFPTCLASTRTNLDFIKKYKGQVYTYAPTPEERFGVERKETYHIDDYRNPICAAVGLAYRFRAEKVLLLCCDDSFKDRRESSVELENGLHTYPHHLKSRDIIDANLYWLTHQEDKEVKVADYSSGAKYVNAVYISSEEEALSFFKDQQEGTPNVQ